MLTIKPKVAPTWFDHEGAGFLLAPLTQYDAIDFRNEISFSKRKLVITGEGIRIAGNAVRDWRNVVDEKGEQIKFDRAMYDELPILTLERVATEVFKRTFLSEIERKN
jgi:hypothetical protein